jgi:hypothetical protein
VTGIFAAGYGDVEGVAPFVMLGVGDCVRVVVEL